MTTVLELKPHPMSRNDGVSKVEVTVLRTPPAVLAVRYRVLRTPGAVIEPAQAMPMRATRLWEHTCFEVFLRGPGTTYWQFNFSPSTQWAAYRFSGNRTGMVDENMPAALVESYTGDLAFAVHAAVDLSHVPGVSRDAPWQLALSAVLEGKDSKLSYWALQHPKGDPDFHHSDGFAYTLPKS